MDKHDKKLDTDLGIKQALLALFEDPVASDGINNITELCDELRKKGLEYSRNTLNRKINPNFKCNNPAGLPKDLNMVNIESAKLKLFESGVWGWTGHFNHELYELASAILPPGYLDKSQREKVKFATKENFKKPEVREKHKKAVENPEHKKRQSERTKALWLIPEKKTKIIENHKRAIENSEYRMRQKEAREKPEFRKKTSENFKAMWSDPEKKAEIIAKCKEAREKPEFRKKTSENFKAMWSDPEKRAEIIAKRKEAGEKPESREKRSQIAKELWANPEYRISQEKARLKQKK